MRTVALGLSLVFIFMIPWEGIIELPGLGTAAKLFGIGMAGFWMLTVVITNDVRKPAAFHILVCLFALWNALSIFWSADPERAVTNLLTWAQLVIMVYILWDLYTTRAAVLAGLQAFVLGTYVAIGSALYNYFSGTMFYDHYERFSPSAQTNPDGFGFTLALAIPLAWYLAGAVRGGKTGVLLKVVNYTYIPVAFVGLALSGTRAALIASIVGMAFGLASLTRIRPLPRVAVFLLLASAILLLLPRVQDLKSFQRLGTTYTELTEGDLNNRTKNWDEGLAAYAEHPVLGVGNSMYRTVNSWGKVAHNSFLSVLVQLGAIGFVLFGMILTIAVVQAWRQPRWHARFWLTTLLVWALGASTLTWEDRKSTWLFLSLLISSTAVTNLRPRTLPPVQADGSTVAFTPAADTNRGG